MRKPQEYFECAERLKALADPDRLRIIKVLLDGEKNVSDLSAELNEQIVKVSHHLGVLRRMKIVQATKRGRFVVYALHPDVFIAPTGPNDSPQIELGCCHLSLG